MAKLTTLKIQTFREWLDFMKNNKLKPVENKNFENKFKK